MPGRLSISLRNKMMIFASAVRGTQVGRTWQAGISLKGFRDFGAFLGGELGAFQQGVARGVAQ